MSGKPGVARRGYDPLDHDQRAAFSRYLQDLRLRASISQGSLALDANVDLSSPGYFEGHPAEPLASAHRRDQLGRICRILAGALGEDESVIVGRVSVLGGGLSDGSAPHKPSVPARLALLHAERLSDTKRIEDLESTVEELGATVNRLGGGVA